MKKIIILLFVLSLGLKIQANDTIRISYSQIQEIVVCTSKGEKPKTVNYCVVLYRGDRILATISKTNLQKLEKALYFRTKLDLFLIIGKTSNRIYVQ